MARLLMGVQACRLPALKPLKPLKRLKRLNRQIHRFNRALGVCFFSGRPTAQLKTVKTLSKRLGCPTAQA